MAAHPEQRYTSSQKTAARHYFQYLANEANPEFPERSIGESIQLELRLEASTSSLRIARRHMRARLRQQPMTEPLPPSLPMRAAMILAADFPMAEGIAVIESQLVRDLQTQQKLLQLVTIADDPYEMEKFLTEKVAAAKARLEEFNNAIFGRRTGPTDTQ